MQGIPAPPWILSAELIVDRRQQRCANSWRVLRCSAPILRPGGLAGASHFGEAVLQLGEP